MTVDLVSTRYFTAASANRMLPLVRAIVQDIVELHRDLEDRSQRLDHLRDVAGSTRRRDDDPYTEEVLQMQRDLDQDAERLKGYVRELDTLGVEFKDAGKGLVDFPTMIDGKIAYLCWRLGETEVGYWHPLNGGDVSRRSLTDGSLHPQSHPSEA